MAKRISATNDLAFKKVLASEENKDILQGIISDFFGVRPEIGDIAIKNPYSVRACLEWAGLKEGEEATTLRQTLRDVSASAKVADITIELQIKKDIFFSERSIYYAFEAFCGNYSRPGGMKTDPGERPNRYSSLKPVYALNILGYAHFPGDNDALRIFALHDAKRGKAFDRDYIRIAYFELAKERTETENQRHWKEYFMTGEASGGAPGYIAKASKAIELANLGKEEKEMADALEKARAIHDSEMYTAWADGITEGEAKGKAEIAVNMLREGMPSEMVSKCTGFSLEEVFRLMKQ
jgi:predicted transposase/invertase (TIGR01784 family)